MYKEFRCDNNYFYKNLMFMEEHKIQHDRIKSVDQRNVVATNDFEDMRKRISIDAQDCCGSPVILNSAHEYRKGTRAKLIIIFVVCLLIVAALIAGVIWLCR